MQSPSKPQSDIDNCLTNILFHVPSFVADFLTEDKSAWRTDQEFAREMLAGVNPVNISLLKVSLS